MTTFKENNSRNLVGEEDYNLGRMESNINIINITSKKPE